MPHSQTLTAIVLQTHNVGEADRFCILFTRERGKIAARARGVRKTKSKMGSTLLPLKHIKVDIVEGNAGYLITGAVQTDSTHHNHNIHPYLHTQQGTEILLAVLHDEEPMEHLFDLTAQFITACSESNPVLPFTLCLIKEMGLLPEHVEGIEEQHYVRMALSREWHHLPFLTSAQKSRFSLLCAELLSDHTTRTLKAGTIANAMISN